MGVLAEQPEPQADVIWSLWSNFEGFERINTVDGRNPAPPGVVETL